MNAKKIFLMIGFILAIGVASVALYWVFFRSPNLPTNNNNTNDFKPGEIPEVNNGVKPVINTSTVKTLPIEKLIDQKVSDVASGGLTLVKEVTKNEAKGLAVGKNGLQYYDKEKQQFFRLGADGKPALLSDQKFYEVDKIIWSPSSDKAILEYPDGNNVLYDFTKNKQVTLPIELKNFSFSKDGERISAAWMGNTEENNWLVVSNSDGSGMKLIEPLADQASNTEIGFSPDGQVVALHRKNSGLNQQEIYPISLQGENLRSFEVQGAGFTSAWSPQGQSLIYSVYNEGTDYLPNLWITKGKTGELGDLKVSLNINTWPDKCSFAGENTLYCAVPQGLPRGAGLYPELSNNYNDNFYQIDLSSGTKTLLASPIGQNGGYSAKNLFLSTDGSWLYFTDQRNGNLQSIRLK